VGFNVVKGPYLVYKYHHYTGGYAVLVVHITLSKNT